MASPISWSYFMLWASRKRSRTRPRRYRTWDLGGRVKTRHKYVLYDISETLKSPISQASIFQSRKVPYSKHHVTLVCFLTRKFARISICHWLNSAQEIWNTCIIQSLIRAYPAHASVTQPIRSWRLRIVTGCQSDMARKHHRKLQIPGPLVTRLCRALPWLASHRLARKLYFCIREELPCSWSSNFPFNLLPLPFLKLKSLATII